MLHSFLCSHLNYFLRLFPDHVHPNARGGGTCNLPESIRMHSPDQLSALA